MGKMKRFIKAKIGIALVFAMVVSLLCGCSCSTTGGIRLGTGDEEGTYYKYGEKLAAIDNSIELKSTAGSEANHRLLENGFIDAAIVQSDSLDVTDTHCAALTGLYTEAVQLVVRKDSGITGIEQLRGKRVSIGEEESGVVRNSQQLLLAAGMTFSDMDAKHLSFTDSVSALQNGQIDAFFCTAGAPTEAVSRITASEQASVISFEDDLLQRLMNVYPGYNSCVIPANTYAGQDYDVHTVGVRAVMIVSPSMSDATAKKLIDEIFVNSEALNSNIVTDGALTGESAVLSVGIPFHPAAVSYLKDKGVVVAEWSGKTKKGVFASQDE